MKKVMILFIILMLCGCKSTDKVTLMVPEGSPLMTILDLDLDTYQIDIVNGPDPLIAAFGSTSHDAIIAPTNLGAKLFASKPEYQLAAILVWGNYHIVSTSLSSNDFNELDQKDILVFGQNQTSDIIIKHLLDIYDISANLTYVDSVQSAAAMFIYDPSLIVMVAEPSLSQIKHEVPDAISIDLQELYADYHQGYSYPQAGLFVRSNLDVETVNELIQSLNESITWVNERSREVIEKCLLYNILDDSIDVSDAIIGSHLLLKTPDESIESIAIYMSLILNMNSNLIGGIIPPAEFYWSDQS